MAFFLAAFGLLLHVFFWGAGLALLATPRRWKSFWPIFCGPAGLALQSAAVWFGAHTDLVGTNAYVWWSEALPLGLLAMGYWRLGPSSRRCLWRDWSKLNGVWLLVAVVLSSLVIPLALAANALTTSSLGSCDAADYAAGARGLQEFAKHDRSGFMGLAEVVQVLSADNFFDYWIRLNHFTPSAIVALNGAAFGLVPHELVSITTAVFLALSLPAVFWLTRAGFGYGPLASLVVTGLYGFSPLLWYAVFHVAMSQILAAQAIAIVTWSGIVLWNGGARSRAGLALSGLMAIAYWLILGAYNFIILVALVPAVAYALGRAVLSRDLRRLVRWSTWMAAPLLVTAAVFTERALGLVERFRLLRQFDFGWKIPALSPEGWLGIVADVSLAAYPAGWRWGLSTIVVLVLVLALLHGAKARKRGVFLTGCCVLPAAAGYAYLLVRANLYGTNASYDAYKLLAVFYPGALAGACYWLTLLQRGGRTQRVLMLVFATVLIGFNLSASYRFVRRMQSPPLMVESALAGVQQVEAMPHVGSLNVLVGDFWSRLWANAFLLKKPQYFRTHTYEARRNTELKGEWDLLSDVVLVRLPPDGDAQADRAALTPAFSLVDTRSRYFLRAAVHEGWYEAERLPRAGARWRWSKGNASILVNNPQQRALKVTFVLNARSLVERDMELWAHGRKLRAFKVGTTLGPVRVPTISIPPGQTMVELRSNTPPVPPGAGDGRLLGFAAYGIELQVRPDGEPLEP